MIQLFIGAQELILLVPVILLYIFCLFDCITNKNYKATAGCFGL